ncbi:MAG: hypothetical protein KDD94_12855, partial [Calditrichaeota bacterium]|nr:hypothetical protein [Calditrichota bacterium]
SPIPEQAINYVFSSKDDKVIFTYVEANGKKFNHITKTFGLNGILLSVIERYPDQSSIEMEPVFFPVTDRWLCQGWNYRKSNPNGDVTEGMQADIIYKEVDGIWFPYDVIIKIQTAVSKPDIIYERIYFRDYLVNGEFVN